MPRSVSSESTASPSSTSTRKRLFSRATNLFSLSGKPGPLLDTNPPPVARPPKRETRKSLSAIKTTFQAAGTPLTLLRRLSTSNAHLKPHTRDDNIPPLPKVKVKRGRGRSHSVQVGRPPSMARSRSAPGAPSLNQSSISPTLVMSDDTSHKSVDEPSGTTTVPHDVDVPVDLQTGVTMTKVSAKESRKVTVRIDPDLGQIFYQSRRARISESLPPFHTLHSRGSPGDLPPRLTPCPTAVTLTNRLTCPFSPDRKHQRTPFRVRCALLPRAVRSRSGD